METKEEEIATSTYRKSYRVSKSFLERLDKHVTIQNLIKSKNLSRQDWIIQAIHERFQKEELSDLINQKDKHINLTIDPETFSSIKERVEILRESLGTYSDKKYILEAIEAKLEEEMEGNGKFVLRREN